MNYLWKETLVLDTPLLKILAWLSMAFRIRRPHQPQGAHVAEPHPAGRLSQPRPVAADGSLKALSSFHRQGLPTPKAVHVSSPLQHGFL